MGVIKSHSLPVVTLANGEPLELFVAELDTGYTVVEIHAHESVLENLDARTIPTNVNDGDWMAIGAEINRKDPALFARIVQALQDQRHDPAAAVVALRDLATEER